MTTSKTEIGIVTKDYITIILKCDDIPETRHRLSWKEAANLVGMINEKIIEKAKYDSRDF